MRRISQKFFFHGSSVELKVGDLLLPFRETNAANAYHYSDPDKIYLTVDLCYAIHVAMCRDEGASWIYRVQPIGKLEPHEKAIVWGFGGDRHRGSPAGGPHFTADKARILARARVPTFFHENREAFENGYFALFAGLITEADLFLKVPDPYPDPHEDPADTHWKIIPRLSAFGRFAQRRAREQMDIGQ